MITLSFQKRLTLDTRLLSVLRHVPGPARYQFSPPPVYMCLSISEAVLKRCTPRILRTTQCIADCAQTIAFTYGADSASFSETRTAAITYHGADPSLAHHHDLLPQTKAASPPWLTFTYICRTCASGLSRFTPRKMEKTDELRDLTEFITSPVPRRIQP